MPHSIADDFKSIPMSSNLGESLERAHRFAREQTHRTVTLEHLLLALTEDQEAALILHAANVDLGRLRADVSGYLGRLLEDMRAEPGSEPKPDPELLRVLQAAASAAQQSKRRQIDGAIVLAAVVGDGKSPAAGTLKAHGMTFEEAIRALQRANSQARLKMPAKAATAKAPEPATTPEAPKPVEPAASVETPVATGDMGSLSARLATQADTADHILAAARARIQQRASAAAAKSSDATPRPATTAQEPQAPIQDPVQAKEATAPAEPKDGANSFEDLLAVSTVAKPEPAPGSHPLPPESKAEPPGRAPRQDWAPPAEMRPPVPRQPPTPAGRAQLPPQGPRPDDGPRQPQSPQRGGPRAGPVPGGPSPPNRQARAPRPEPGEHPGRPAGLNGSSQGGPRPGAPSRAPRAGASRGPQGDRGPLVESVPRRMRIGVTSKAEVRIARDRIEALVVALNGHSMPHRPDQIAARALAVRLKAPNGGFLIESVSPETQWVEGPSGLGHDDYAIWRWTVTPQRRGRGRLLLMVSARTVGQDGLAAESAPPDRLIDVRVASNGMRRLGRWLAWLLALAIGVALGKFSDQIWEAGTALLGKMLAG
jgi:hypothetical protein